MQLATSIRSTLFFGGLLAIALSVGLDGIFATDSTTPVPEPGTWSLLAAAGVAAVAGSIIRRRKK